MIQIKNPTELKLMLKAGELAAQALELAGKNAVAGATTWELDRIVADYIKSKGGSCPCKGFCLSCANGTAEQLPVKSPKRGRRKEDMTVFLLRCRDEFALQKRPAGGLLANLWQFPNTPSKLNTNETLTWMEDNGLKPKEIIMQMERKHAFTHIEWDMRGVYVRVADKTPGYVWRSREQINAETALPTAFRLFWDEIQVFDGL